MDSGPYCAGVLAQGSASASFDYSESGSDDTAGYWANKIDNYGAFVDNGWSEDPGTGGSASMDASSGLNEIYEPDVYAVAPGNFPNLIAPAMAQAASYDSYDASSSDMTSVGESESASSFDSEDYTSGEGSTSASAAGSSDNQSSGDGYDTSLDSGSYDQPQLESSQPVKQDEYSSDSYDVSFDSSSSDQSGSDTSHLTQVDPCSSFGFNPCPVHTVCKHKDPSSCAPGSNNSCDSVCSSAAERCMGGRGGEREVERGRDR